VPPARSEREGLPTLLRTRTSRRALLVALPAPLGCPFPSTRRCSLSGRRTPSPLTGTAGGRESGNRFPGCEGAEGSHGRAALGGEPRPKAFTEGNPSLKRGPEPNSRAGFPGDHLCREERGRQQGCRRCTP